MSTALVRVSLVTVIINRILRQHDASIGNGVGCHHKFAVEAAKRPTGARFPTFVVPSSIPSLDGLASLNQERNHGRRTPGYFERFVARRIGCRRAAGKRPPLRGRAIHLL